MLVLYLQFGLELSWFVVKLAGVVVMVSEGR